MGTSCNFTKMCCLCIDVTVFDLCPVTLRLQVMASRQGLSLFFGNLPWTVSARELRSYVSQFGPVAWARVVFDPKTGLSKVSYA